MELLSDFIIGLLPPLLILLVSVACLPANRSCVFGLSRNISLTVVICFLVAWIDYCFRWHWMSTPLLLGVGILIVAGRRQQLAANLRLTDLRAPLRAYALLTAYLFIHVAAIQFIYGGLWAGDWFEHYDRALFFLEYQPLNTIFLDVYTLTARPPLVNLLGAQWMSLSGDSFAISQLVILFFGSLVFFPLAALCEYFQGQRTDQRNYYLLALLLCVTPMFLGNILYPWTKMPCNALILQGLVCQLAARANKRPTDRVWAYGFMGMAFVAHYSAGPFIIAMVCAEAVDDLLHGRFREHLNHWITGGLVGAAAVFIWLGWSIYHFGVAGTFLTNSTVTSNEEGSLVAWLLKVGDNINATLVPVWLRTSVPVTFESLQNLTKCRDIAFCYYQQNWFFFVGPAIFAVWVALIWKQHREWHHLAYWTVYGLIGFVLGIAVHSGPSVLGLSHICLQSLALVIIAFVATQFRDLGRLARWTVVVFGAVAWVTGVYYNTLAQAYVGPGDPAGFLTMPANELPITMMLSAMKITAFQYHLLSSYIQPSLTVFTLVNVLILTALIWLYLKRPAPKPAR